MIRAAVWLPFVNGGKVMGRKSIYSEYAKGMKKKADAKNAATKSHNKSIKDRLKNLKEESKKGVK